MAFFRRALTVVDRTTIEVRLLDGWGVRAIAAVLGRSAGTISGEIARHRDGKLGYRAEAAVSGAAAARHLSGRRIRMGVDGVLFGSVARLLRLKWSPEQISGRRRRIEGGMQTHSGLTVSHEAIYALPRGELHRELVSCLRQYKPMRWNNPKGNERRGKL